MKKTLPKKGELWTSLASGKEFMWDGSSWRETGRTPYGADPMKLIKKAGSEKPHASGEAGGSGPDNKV